MSDAALSVHERIAANGDAKPRTVKVDYYGNGGTVALGIVRGNEPRAAASTTLTIAQARELIAALDAACDAIGENVAQYHAAREAA